MVSEICRAAFYGVTAGEIVASYAQMLTPLKQRAGVFINALNPAGMWRPLLTFQPVEANELTQPAHPRQILDQINRSYSLAHTPVQPSAEPAAEISAAATAPSAERETPVAEEGDVIELTREVGGTH